MQKAKLISLLLNENQKENQRLLYQKNVDLLDLKFAENLKDTYYKSWTNEPQNTKNAALALKVLTEFLPEKEVKAFYFWVAGIAELTQGKTEIAIEYLNESAEIFTSLGKIFQAAQTQVSKIYALSLLGKYDEALIVGKKALTVFKNSADKLTTGKIEMNIGNILLRRGFPSDSEKYFLAARKRFSDLNELTWLTMCENNLAIIYSSLNYFRRAEKFYESALKNARQAKMFVTEAEIEASMGNLALFRGNFAEALKYLELSRQKYEKLEMPHQKAIAELEIAEIYLELNLTDEAFQIYEKVSGILKKLKLQSEEARARANFGRAAFVLNDFKTSKTQLQKAEKLYLAEKNPIGAAAVKIAEANLEKSRGNTEKSLENIRQAKKYLEKNENLRHLLTANHLEGEILREAKNFAEAERIFAENFSQARKYKQPQKALSALNSLGKTALETNEIRQAEKFFKQAVKLVETLRTPLAGEEFRMSFLADKLAPFENSAKIYLSQSKLKQAFEILEKSSARALVENVNQNFDNKIPSKKSSELQKKSNLLREELNWFYSRFNRAENSEIKDLREQIAIREKEFSEVFRQIESTAEIKKNGAANFSLKELQSKLGTRKTLIRFTNLSRKISVFVVTRNKISYVENLASEDEILNLAEGLQFQFGAMRYGADIQKKFLPELKKRADFYLEKLYRKLIAPLESLIQNFDLIIVPAGVLHYVPFNALRDERETYLVEDREVTVAPSASVWQTLARKSKPRKFAKALLIGFADEKIPLVNREIRRLKKLFDDSESFVGKNAVFSAYTENAKRFDILHLACHGHFRSENPMFSSLHLADAWITVRDICSQRLKAELVTLSACETGLNKIYSGEEILGLTRGFLSAGAKNLVMSLWTVNDEATTELMQSFYKNLQRGETVATSLKTAQKKFIEREKHPYFWASFVVIGK